MLFYKNVLMFIIPHPLQKSILMRCYFTNPVNPYVYSSQSFAAPTYFFQFFPKCYSMTTVFDTYLKKKRIKDNPARSKKESV